MLSGFVLCEFHPTMGHHAERTAVQGVIVAAATQQVVAEIAAQHVVAGVV